MADYDMAAPDVANGAGNGDRSPSGDRAAPSGDRSPVPAREGSETGSRRATGNYERERSDRPRDRSRSRSPYSRGGGSGSYSRRDDRDRSPRRGRPPPPPPGRNAEAPPSNVLGCFGLSIRTRDIDLEDEFSRYGQVEKAVIVYDQRSERSRGFGFVTMREQEDAARCIEKLNGIELHGRNIRVAYSMTTKPHQSTPGEYMGFKTDDRDGDRSYRRDDRGPRRDYDDRPPRRDYDDRRGGYDDRRGGGYDDRRGGGYGGGRRDYDDRRAPLPSPRDYDDDRAPRRSRDDSPPRRRSPIPPPRE